MPRPTSDRRATERKHPWPMVRLGDVCEVFTDGDWIESKDQAKSGIRLIQTGNVGVGEYLDKADRSKFISDSTFERLKCTEIYPGDVLVSRLPEPVGRSCVLPLLNQRMITAVDCSIVRFKSFILPEFFVAYSQTFQYEAQILSYLTGSTRQRISRGNLAKIEIPLPPLSVQREIVARLERELAAVEKMKKGFEALAETAKAEFKAELKEVFEEISRGGAETRRLGEVCEKIGSGATPLGGKKTYIENGTSLIRSQNVIDFSFSFLGLAHISETQAAQLDSVSVFDGDVLVNITGDSVARVCIVDNRCLPARVNQHVAIIRLSHSANVLNRYLEACLVAMKDELLKESVKGSTRKALTKDYLINLEIPVPPLSAQREVVARLDSAKARAEKLEAKAREGVAVCETMRKAILKEAFDDGRASPAIGKVAGR